jgi:hypothetical protein
VCDSHSLLHFLSRQSLGLERPYGRLRKTSNARNLATGERLVNALSAFWTLEPKTRPGLASHPGHHGKARSKLKLSGAHLNSTCRYGIGMVSVAPRMQDLHANLAALVEEDTNKESARTCCQCGRHCHRWLGISPILRRAPPWSPPLQKSRVMTIESEL